MRYSFTSVTTFNAILPAGGTIPSEFAAIVGTENKALISFEGKTILERTLIALKESGFVHRTTVIGTPEVLESQSVKQVDFLLPATGSGPTNILSGLKHISSQPNPPAKVLIVTTDLPFLSCRVISDFVKNCPTDSDICVPLITKTQYDTKFPGSGATFIPLRDNTWTAGCAYLMDVTAFQSALPQIEKVFENRKSKLGMVRLLGLKFLVKFLTKSLTVPDVEAKIQTMIHCSGRAVLDSPAELAFDIDAMDDYEYAKENFHRFKS